MRASGSWARELLRRRFTTNRSSPHRRPSAPSTRAARALGCEWVTSKTTTGKPPRRQTLRQDHLGRADGHVGGAQRSLHRAQGTLAIGQVGGDLHRPAQRGRGGQRLVEPPRAAVAAGPGAGRRSVARPIAALRSAARLSITAMTTARATPNPTSMASTSDRWAGSSELRHPVAEALGRLPPRRCRPVIAMPASSSLSENAGRTPVGLSRRPVATGGRVDAGGVVEQEDVLEGDHVALHALRPR